MQVGPVIINGGGGGGTTFNYSSLLVYIEREAAQSIPTGAVTPIEWDATITNSPSWTIGSAGVTIGAAGYYLVAAAVSVTTGSANKIVRNDILVNTGSGAAIVEPSSQLHSTVTTAPTVVWNWRAMELAANDVVSAQIFHNRGSAWNTESFATLRPSLFIWAI